MMLWLWVGCTTRTGNPRRSQTFQLSAMSSSIRSQARRAAVSNTQEGSLYLVVRDNNVDQALRALKKKMQKEGVFPRDEAPEVLREDIGRKRREKKAKQSAEHVSSHESGRQREGLIAAPRKKEPDAGKPVGRRQLPTHIVDDTTQGESCHGSASTGRDHTPPRRHAGCARTAKTGAERGHAR
jgi:ribosomal protein S21